MTANVTVAPDYDLASIASAAGNSDVEGRWYQDGVLYVSGVEQSALDSALASFNAADATAAGYKLEIAAKRYERETAGITTAGYTVYTDRASQMKLTGVALRASQDSSYSVDWKLTDGTFVTLTGAQITAIANAVGDYVQACYTREAALLAAVASGTYTAEMLDALVSDTVTEGWPAQE